MKKKIIIGVSAALIVIAAIAAGVIMGVSSKKKSSNDINVSCKAVVTKNDDITCYDWLKKLCNKTGVEAENYRKAAKENGYITDSDKFSDDDIASGGFIALTSMRAMGEGKMQIYLGRIVNLHHLQKVNHFIMKYLLMARNSLWMNVHIMSSQKMISQRKVRQVQKHRHRNRRHRELMQKNQDHFILIRQSSI